MFFSLGVQTQVFVICFLIAVVPVFAGFRPFTFYISRRKYPESIVSSDKFLKVNNAMSLIWGALFLLAAVLAHVTEGSVWSYVLPVCVFVLLGGLVNRKMPDYLSSRIKSKKMQFLSVKEMMQAIPHGIKKERTEGKEFSIAYRFTGDEPANYLLIVKDGGCSVQETDADADLVISCESRLWLDIAAERASSVEAFMEGRIRAEGDLSLILEMEELLGKDEKHVKHYQPDYPFKQAPADSIKRIVVIDGSPRGDSKSKTRIMAKAFLNGALTAGANGEYITLKDVNIKPCCGCYTCWAVTPGECIFKDDMNSLLKHIAEADLIVFATPLYFFSVTGIMKNFMDRMLPLVDPHIVSGTGGQVSHKKRTGKKQYYAVISASGFPDIKGNFDGVTALFRALDKHSDGYGLMGEILLPGAEAITQPIYSKKRAKLEDLLEKMGADAVRCGKIDAEDMAEAAKPIMDRAKYIEQANAYWDSLLRDNGRN